MSDYSGVAAQSNLNQSQAFAAALQRAKQIAAKIQPNQQGPQGGGGVVGVGVGGGGGGYKRNHDDSDSGPESKRFTSPGSDYGQNNSNMSSGSGGGGSSGGPANMSQALAQAAAVAARLAAAAGTCEEQVRIPESIANQVFGRGSNDTITHIQAESGCKVQLPQDQSDRIITLRGSRDTVTKGREMLQQFANRTGSGETVDVVLSINMPPPGPTGYPPYQEIMIPGQKVGLVIGKGGDTIKQLQEKTGAKMVIIQEGPNQEVIVSQRTDKPLRISGDPQKIEHAKQLVMDLIATKEVPAQNARGPNMNNNGQFNNFAGGNPGGEQCEIFVPKIAVGVVIGKGGDMIRKIQAETGCKLQFIQGKNDEPGDRRCLVQGNRQQVDDGKRMIEGLIENVMVRNQGNRNQNGNGAPDNGNSNYGYGYGVNHAQNAAAREEITFMVPASKCGIVIGRGGETIKLINQQSGAYCEMDRNATNPPSEKLFKCKGTAEQVEAARQMIAEKINMEISVISRKPISGGPPMPNNQVGGYPQMPSDPAAAYQQQWANYAQAGWGDQSQQAMGMGQGAAAAGGAANQADYSQQWIEYYRSMGMHREAEMIEQQVKAKQAAVGGAGGGMPQQQPQQQQQQPQAAAQPAAGGADASQDYSAQWAEYYRSIGKIDEAEEIERQMKAKQNSQPSNQNASAPGGGNGAANNNQNPVGGNPAAAAAAAAAAHGYPQGMTASQYAQYSQYYAAAAAAGQHQQPGAPVGMGGYPQPYGGYGGYPGAPQPPGGPGGPNGQQKKPDKN